MYVGPKSKIILCLFLLCITFDRLLDCTIFLNESSKKMTKLLHEKHAIGTKSYVVQSNYYRHDLKVVKLCWCYKKTYFDNIVNCAPIGGGQVGRGVDQICPVTRCLFWVNRRWSQFIETVAGQPKLPMMLRRRKIHRVHAVPHMVHLDTAAAASRQTVTQLLVRRGAATLACHRFWKISISYEISKPYETLLR